MSVQYERFVLGPLQTNSYLLHNGKEAVVIDPAAPAPELRAILDYLRDKKLILTHILNTHLHFDHTGGNHELAAQTRAPILASERDSYMLESELGLGGVYGLPEIQKYSFSDLDAGGLPILEAECMVIATPGHSPGGLCFHFPVERLLFAGDTLFQLSVGRSDFPGGDSDTLMRSIQGKLFTLPPETQVLPGHGPFTTVETELAHNPFCGRGSL